MHVLFCTVLYCVCNAIAFLVSSHFPSYSTKSSLNRPFPRYFLKLPLHRPFVSRSMSSTIALFSSSSSSFSSCELCVCVVKTVLSVISCGHCYCAGHRGTTAAHHHISSTEQDLRSNLMLLDLIKHRRRTRRNASLLLVGPPTCNNPFLSLPTRLDGIYSFASLLLRLPRSFVSSFVC